MASVLLLAGTADAAPVCRTVGAAPLTRPDQDCTPGSYVFLSRAEVCASKERPTLPAATRRYIVGRYGVPLWSGIDGELDHRVPLFLGGRTNAGNVWPERGAIPNPKDRLEAYVRLRVCVRRSMRVGYARHVFLGNWAVYYRRYLLGD